MNNGRWVCRRRRSSARRLVWRSLLVALVFAGFGMVAPVNAGRLPRYGGDLRFRLAAVPLSMDPLRMHGDDGALVASCVYEGLTRWDSADLGPSLARQWVRDEDAKRWLFYLRNDAVFHDGTRCDANAVRQSLERLADPRQSPYAWVLADLVGWDDFAAGRTATIEGLDVIEGDQIELRFTNAASDLPARLALPCASITRRRGEDWLGTGPFQVLALAPGVLRLSAFRDHSGGRPYVDHVEFVAKREIEPPLADAVVEVNRVLVADGLPAGATRWRTTAERLGLAVVNPQSSTVNADGFRDKLAASFDRAVFVRAVLGGDGRGTEGISPAGLKTVTARTGEPTADLAARPQQKARVIVAASEPVLRALGERMQVHLFALGLAADLDVLSADAFEQALVVRSFDIAIVGWTPPQPAVMEFDPSTRAQLLASSVLSPLLRDTAPEAWAPARIRAAKDPEQALLRGDWCVPLVFFHDLWQTTADIANFQPGAVAPALGVASAYFAPRTP